MTERDFAELRLVLADAIRRIEDIIAKLHPEPHVGTAMRCPGCGASLIDCVTDEVSISYLHGTGSYCCRNCEHVQRYYQAAAGNWVPVLAHYIPTPSPEDDVDSALEAVREQQRMEQP